MNIDTLELHDAIVQSASIDYASKRVSLMLELYESASEKQRTRVELTFDEVESMSHVADFKRLEKNRFAGNVNYWVPGDAQSPTFIYLTDGVITIASHKSPSVRKAS